jgi:hypothetical protein
MFKGTYKMGNNSLTLGYAKDDSDTTGVIIGLYDIGRTSKRGSVMDISSSPENWDTPNLIKW